MLNISKTRNNNRLFSLIMKEMEGHFRTIKQKFIKQEVTIDTKVW